MKSARNHLIVVLLSFGLTTGAYSWWLAPIPIYEIPMSPSTDLQRLNHDMQLSRAVYKVATQEYRKIKKHHGKNSPSTLEALEKVKAAKKEYRRSKDAYYQAEEKWLSGLPVEEK
jgi:hypothetical protein